MKIGIRCFVSGHVQGVWYRAATRKQALTLGVTGYARNLPDGRVEVLACGEEKAVIALREWLWQGPPHARVSDVRWQAAADPEPPDFTVG
jgi:acylphosphatase